MLLHSIYVEMKNTYLLGHDTHSPMPFLAPPCPGPKVSIGLFTVLSFPLGPYNLL